MEETEFFAEQYRVFRNIRKSWKNIAEKHLQRIKMTNAVQLIATVNPIDVADVFHICLVHRFTLVQDYCSL